MPIGIDTLTGDGGSLGTTREALKRILAVCLTLASPAAARSGTAGAQVAPVAPATDSFLPVTELHGGVAAYLYQPTNGPDGQYFIYANLKLGAKWDWFGIYFEPRMSSEKMRSYYDSLAWIQQAYLSLDLTPVSLKVGKLYKRVGLAWDRSFYGNIQVYEGLKFDPDQGISLEGQFGKEIGAIFSAQYFFIDGQLNASLAGRDTVSIPGARRRNIVAARLEPFWQLNRNSRLTLGLSGEGFQADLPDARNDVLRFAADMMLTVGHFGMWGEVLQQWGAHVPSFPYGGDPSTIPPTPGRSSAQNTYLLAGAEFALGPFVPRYNISIATYHDVSVREVLHLPGVSINIHPHATLFIEYAFWDRLALEGGTIYDRSLNMTAMGFF